MKRRLLEILLATTLASTAAACSDGGEESPAPKPNAGPSITSIDGPAEFAQQGDLYVIALTLRATDPEGDVITRARIRIAGLGIDQAQDIQQASAAAEGIVMQLGLPTSIPKQTYTVTFNLVDARGAAGPDATKEIAVP
jgi:hypothetical protein